MESAKSAYATVDVIDPSTGDVINSFAYTSEDAIDSLLDDVAGTARQWGMTTPETRARAIRRLGDILHQRREPLARQITREMGKPLAQALGEIDKCVHACEYYGASLPAMLEPERVDLGGDAGKVRLVPLGVVLAILPWNYPWWQVIRAMLPAIAAGNTVVLKHADSVTGAALEIETVFRQAFGNPVLRTVIADPATTSRLIDDPRITAVTFTGSDRVGALVAARAGAALKKCVLELGGSDPFIVLSDANIEAAAAAAVRSRFLNNGQSCIAAKRILVHDRIKAAFIAAMVPRVQALRVGDPTQETVDVGPLARFDLRDTLRAQRERALAEGGVVLAEAEAPIGAGAWFAPTIVEVPDRSSILMTDETFGPLGALSSAPTDRELIDMANDSRFGLSSSIWGEDLEHAEELSSLINAGSVFINAISATDPRLPTGGVKASGYGRELGKWGIAEMANVQSLRIHRI